MVYAKRMSYNSFINPIHNKISGAGRLRSIRLKIAASRNEISTKDRNFDKPKIKQEETH